MATSSKSILSPLAMGALVAACAFAMCAGDAMAQRRGGGGGARGGGGGGFGGRTAQASVSGGNRSGASRTSASGGNRSANYGGGDRTRSSGDRTRTSGDRSTNIGSNNNVNIDRGDVNIDVEGGYGYRGGYGYHHPVAAGITIGAIAGSVATAAAYGSYYYALPPSGCVMVVRAGANYWQCGTAYYQEAMDGDTVVYMSVQP